MLSLHGNINARSELANWLAKESETPPQTSWRFMGGTPLTPKTPKAPTPHKRSIFSKRSNEAGTAFQGLQTEMGAKDLLVWFERNQNMVAGGLPELVFIKALRNMINVQEYVLCDLFDLLDFSKTGVVKFEEFHMCISLFCALESQELTHFMYLHGRKLFLLMYPSDDSFVNIEHTKMILQLFSLQEQEIIAILKLFVKGSPETIDYATFMMVMSCVADDWDAKRTGRNLLYKPKKEKQKPATSKTAKNKSQMTHLESFDACIEEDDPAPQQNGNSSSSDDENTATPATPSGADRNSSGLSGSSFASVSSTVTAWTDLGVRNYQPDGCRVS